MQRKVLQVISRTLKSATTSDNNLGNNVSFYTVNEKQMKDQGINQKFRLRWKKKPEGKVFDKKNFRIF